MSVLFILFFFFFILSCHLSIFYIGHDIHSRLDNSVLLRFSLKCVFFQERIHKEKQCTTVVVLRILSLLWHCRVSKWMWFWLIEVLMWCQVSLDQQHDRCTCIYVSWLHYLMFPSLVQDRSSLALLSWFVVCVYVYSRWLCNNDSYICSTVNLFSSLTLEEWQQETLDLLTDCGNEL